MRTLSDAFIPELPGYYKGKVRVIPFGPERLFAPMISVGDYIDLVMVTLVTFGLAFQLPLGGGVVEGAVVDVSRQTIAQS